MLAIPQAAEIDEESAIIPLFETFQVSFSIIHSLINNLIMIDIINTIILMMREE